MHIHGASPHQYVAQLYAAGNDARGLEARRSVQTRRKVSGTARQLDATGEETSFVRQLSDFVAEGENDPNAVYPQRDRNPG